MKITRVQIRGFRSIESMDLDFEGNGHKVLVGKNESGKSNILKALNLLSGNHKFGLKDKKELYDGVEFVRFVAKLSPTQIANCREKFYKLFPYGVEEKLTTKHKLATSLTVEKFFQEHSKNITYKATPDSNGAWTYFMLTETKASGQWHRVTGDVPSDLQLSPQLAPGTFVNQNHIEQLHQEQKEVAQFLAPVEIIDIHTSLRTIIKEEVAPENYVFPVLNWQYSAQEHDLPSHVNREEFSQNPDSCIPLMNMFLLANIKKEDIQTEINEATKKGHNHLKNLLNKVNRKTNAYINKNWKEYKEVEVELRPDGDKLVIGIKELNAFDFSQRSDGFRRLVSFLLMMSIENEGNDLEGKLILIDEPEVGLHPSSAKDLRNKLIELGKNNLVVYATHSISMIDTENTENNLIVIKEKEETRFQIAKEDGISSAENIYRAIGYSIYENLKQKNILVEGHTDKKPLSLCMKEKKWKDFGICYTDGVKNIKSITPILDLVDRKYFVLSDADQPAIQKKREMGNPDYWYTYQDLGSDGITIEDFYKQDFFNDIVKVVLLQHKIIIQDADITVVNRIKFVKDFLIKNDTEQKLVNEITKEIKLNCIKDIKKTNLEESKVTAVLDKLLENISPSDGQ